jgi:glutamate synthase (NADPH/NADH) large chain
LHAGPEGQPRTGSGSRNDNPSKSLSDLIEAEVTPFIERGEKTMREYGIRNIDRSVPVRLNYHIIRCCGEAGMPEDTITLRFRGVAGQSFGAFNHNGLTLLLTGEANDYVGKGMHGGIIAIRPGDDLPDAHQQVIAGNTVLYGATGGEFFAAGLAGERFAVRNSGAVAVIEGTGHHCCEYMTRGEVLVLGEVGYNVGAGMTGGVLYVYDEPGTIEKRLNDSYVTTAPFAAGDHERIIALTERHRELTGSVRAAVILSDFSRRRPSFRKIVPKSN